MADALVLLSDYKSHFGSSYAAEPYRSGMDVSRLCSYFEDAGFRPERLGFPDVDFRGRDWSGVPILYTSSEDQGGRYKSYIEDIILGLDLASARVIPRYPLLRAHDNKVFMEILRDLALADSRRGTPPAPGDSRVGPSGPRSGSDEFGGIESAYFGTLEEWESRWSERPTAVGPTVLKPAAGALSRGVGMSADPGELRAKIERISRIHDLRNDLWDLGRALRRKGYVRESRNRRKFITQNFVPGLDHDWKILIYGDRYYALQRGTRPNDFRASGGGKLVYERELPAGLLEFAERVFRALDLPHVSLDVGVTEDGFRLFEFQALYFGTYTLDHSEFHFVRADGRWELVEGSSELERIYADSVIRFLRTPTR